MTTESIDKGELLARAKELLPTLKKWRRTIHRYPELGFDEHRTAALVNSTLIDLGIATETEIAKTGVVGHIRGLKGPTVGLRADMDALPIQERNDDDFSSTRPGLMHACGHDAHTAILLGAATLLQELADDGRLPGNVRLIFQPSEETQDAQGKSGGMRMVEEGALQDIDAIFGLHVEPTRDVGYVATRPGPMMAAADEFELVIQGSGGHAARPHAAVDPIALAGLVINSIQQIVSRRLPALEPGVVTIGTIHGGTVSNVIPDSVTMTGTLRSFTPESRQLLREELTRACGVVESMGGAFDLTINLGYPPTVNDVKATETMIAATTDLLDAAHVQLFEQTMGAEDFSYLALHAPGCFLRLGVHDPEWEDSYFLLHRADFKMDENALPIGAAALASAAIQWMENER